MGGGGGGDFIGISPTKKGGDFQGGGFILTPVFIVGYQLNPK